MLDSRKDKPKLLLHICCATCGVYISNLLEKEHKITLFFYNPNIFPQKEYKKRLNETKKIAKIYSLNLITGDYNHSGWLKAVKGRERDPEGEERCRICYQYRLEKTARRAKEKGFDYFTTTLSVSPHKKFKIISAISKELEEKYNVAYLDKDFKKQDGFKKSIELSKELDLYRQSYCGCEFSVR